MDQTCITCSKTKPVADFYMNGNGTRPRKKCRACKNRERHPGSPPKQPRVQTATTARCAACKKDKPRAEFAVDKARSRLHSYCRDCFNKLYRTRYVQARKACYARNKERYREAARARKRAAPGAPGYAQLKYKARKRGIPFTLTYESYLALRAEPSCVCCGNPVAWTCHGPPHTRASVDRFQPNRGYVPGNVNVLCGRCNVIKNDATPAQIELVLNWCLSKVQENS